MTDEERFEILKSAQYHLNEKIEYYKNQDYFIYNTDSEHNVRCSYYHCKSVNKPKCHVCFNFFEEWNDIIKYGRHTTFKIQEPEQNFNYYLLIKKSYYKEFKKEKPRIVDYRNTFTGQLIFPIISKFIKEHYNKKNIIIDGVDYIRLKLRYYNNTFTPHFVIYFNNSVKLKSNKIRENIKIMAKPQLKKYSTLITIDNDFSLDFKNVDLDKLETIKISDDIILYVFNDSSNKNNFYKMINLVENFIIFNEKKFFDLEKYMTIVYCGILKNTKKDIYIYLSFIGYYKN